MAKRWVIKQAGWVRAGEGIRPSPTKILLRWIVMGIVIGILGGGGASAQGTEDLRFFLTFVPNVQFAPIYVAIEKGYAEAAGLNMTIEHGDEPVGVDLIAADELKFGIISGEQVILARAGGRPVVSVYEWFQKLPVGIVVPDTTEGVESVADLAGKKIGIPGRFGASYSGLVALLDAYGMDERDIQLEPIGFAAPDVICAGGVEASVIYINNEPLQIQQRADAGECGGITGVQVLPVAADVDMVSNGLVTNEKTIAQNPELVRAMVQAFDAGVRDTINNPAEAYLISLDYVENLPIDDAFREVLQEAAANQAEFLAGSPDRAVIAASRTALLHDLMARFSPEMLIQFEVLLATIDLWDAERLGYSDPASWELTQQVIDSMGMLPKTIDLNAAFTNDFLPEYDDGE